MLDIQPSPTIPYYALRRHDAVHINGIVYRPIDQTESGYVPVRNDGQGVAESFTRTEVARLVERKVLVHERNAFLPESEKRRLDLPSNLLSTLSDKKHRTAKFREAVVQGFLVLERKGKINRIDPSISAALPEIKIEVSSFL